MRIILTLLFFSPIMLFSQPGSKSTLSPVDLDSIIYDINNLVSACSEFRFPFSKIEIIDSRFDTSKLGFTFNPKDKNLTYRDFKRVKLLNGVADNIQQFYNNNYKSCFDKSDDRLLIVLKKLWISNLPVSLQSERESNLENPSLQDIYVKFEFYLQKGNAYYPLVRIDTLYQLKNEDIKSEGTEFRLYDLSFFNHTIKSIIEKLDFNNLVSKIANKRKLYLSEIIAFNEKRFLLPVLTDVKFNRGVFINSNEFINNAPSYKDFTLNKKGELSTYGNGKERIAECWAFSDSNGLHLRSAKEVEIFRTGNTFEFFNEEDIHVSRTITGHFIDVFSFIPSPGIFAPPVYQSGQTRVKTIILPRQLDMETGEVY